jgi:hypothetical protein
MKHLNLVKILDRVYSNGQGLQIVRIDEFWVRLEMYETLIRDGGQLRLLFETEDDLLCGLKHLATVDLNGVIDACIFNVLLILLRLEWQVSTHVGLLGQCLHMSHVE